MAYKAELGKQVEAAAAQRGEATANPDAAVTSGNLLENLALQDKEAAVAAFKPVKQPTVAQPKAQLASQMSGTKGKLVVTPPNSGGLSVPMLRKPASKTSSAMLLKKKPSGGASSKLRVNKLVVKQPSGGGSSDDAFDDIDAVQKAAAEEPKPVAAPAPVVAAPAPPPAPAPAPKVPEKPKSSMETGMAKLQAMNNDFFSGI